MIEDFAKLSVRVELASEYRYRRSVVDPDNLVAVIDQSGEAADTPAAMCKAKEQGLKALAIVNVIGSVVVHEADFMLYIYAGSEISVATTKAYSTQLIGVYLLAIYLGKACDLIDEREEQRLLAETATLPEKVQCIIDDKERLQWSAAKLSNTKDVFFIGRDADYAICVEGNPRMKEISYIHSEAYAAGGLKHGTTSLIEDGILVIGILTRSELYEKALSNLIEVKSRGAYLMGLTTSGNYDIEDTVNFALFPPKTDEYSTDSLAVVPLQLLGYYLATSKGFDVDRSRNPARSVIVE